MFRPYAFTLIFLAFFSILSAQASWETVRIEDFSNAGSPPSLANISGLAQSGLSLSANGATGALSDLCAGGTWTNGKYLSFQHQLTAAYEYRISCNAKATATNKKLQFAYASSPGTNGSGYTPVGSLHNIAFTATPSTPGTDIVSDVFTISADGTYHITIAADASGSASAVARVDNYKLERRALLQPTRVYFASESLSVQEGESVAVCVNIENPANVATMVEVEIFGEGPHFLGFTPVTLTFPANSSTPQCFELASVANNQPDLNTYYTLALVNISGGYEALYGTLFMIDVNIEDTTPPAADCPWAGEDKKICKGTSIEIGCEGYAGSEHYCYSWFDENGDRLPVSNSIISVTPNVTTRYTLYVTDGYGEFIAIDDVTVEVATIQEIMFTPPNPMGCFPSESVLVSANEGYLSYAWSNGGNTSVNSFTQPGIYELTVTTDGGCQASKTILVKNISTADGIESFFLEKSFYKIPITILPPPPGATQDATKNLLSCNVDPCAEQGICVFSDISSLTFKISGDEVEDFELIVTENAEYLSENFGIVNNSIYITHSANVCSSCPDYLNLFWNRFNAHDNSTWFSFIDKEGDNDALYVLTNVQNQAKHLPDPTDHNHLDFLRGLIDSSEPPYVHPPYEKEERVVFSIQLMTSAAIMTSLSDAVGENSTTPYIPCGGGTQTDIICVAPSGIPLRVPPGYLLKYGFKSYIQESIFPGALSAITNLSEGKYYPSVSRISSPSSMHEGYHSFDSKSFYIYDGTLITQQDISEVIFGYIQREGPDGNLLGVQGITVPWVELPCPILSLFKDGYQSIVATNRKTNGDYQNDISVGIVSLPSNNGYPIITAEINCPIPIDFEAFNKPLYVKPIPNPNTNELQWLIVSVGQNRQIQYIISEINATGGYDYYIWDCLGASWLPFSPPNRPPYDLVGDLIIFGFETFQEAFFVAQMLPVLSDVIDVGSLIYYSIQQDWNNALVSGISLAIPYFFIKRVPTSGWGMYLDEAAEIPAGGFISKLNIDGQEIVEDYGPTLRTLLDRFDEMGMTAELGTRLINRLIQPENYSLYLLFKNNSSYLRGWKALAEVHGGDRALRLWDENLIMTTTTLLDNTVFMSRLGETFDEQKSVLQTIISRNNIAPCCGIASTLNPPYLVPIHEYLDDVRHFVVNYSEVENADRVIRQMQNGAQTGIDEVAHLIRTIREDPILAADPNLLRKFEPGLANPGATGNNRGDILHGPINGIQRLTELKSYKKATIDGISSDPDFYGQFRAYLGNTNTRMLDGESLRYLFNARKLTLGTPPDFPNVANAESYIRNKFISMIQANQDEVFTTIFSNPNLRNSLFEDAPIMEARTIFNMMLNDGSNSLFGFIKVL